MNVINIFLAEDHTLIRSGIRALLEKESDFRIVGEAATGTEALEKIKHGKEPDILLADMNTFESEGAELISMLSSNHGKLCILSTLDKENYVIEAMKNGASGYVLENASREELIFAIRHIAQGNKYICSELSAKILSSLTDMRDHTGHHEKIKVELSKREKEVLNFIAQGLTNNEIANRLFTSRRTIEGYRKNLIDKTNTRNTAALICFAVSNGLLDF